MNDKITKLIKEIESDYRSIHHYSNASNHPIMKKDIDRDVQGLKHTLKQLIQEVERQQINLCVETYFTDNVIDEDYNVPKVSQTL